MFCVLLFPLVLLLLPCVFVVPRDLLTVFFFVDRNMLLSP